MVMTSLAGRGTVVCRAVSGAFSFDRHLPFAGLLEGWYAGLTAGEYLP